MNNDSRIREKGLLFAVCDQEVFYFAITEDPDRQKDYLLNSYKKYETEPNYFEGPSTKIIEVVDTRFLVFTMLEFGILSGTIFTSFLSGQIEADMFESNDGGFCGRISRIDKAELSDGDVFKEYVV